MATAWVGKSPVARNPKAIVTRGSLMSAGVAKALKRKIAGGILLFTGMTTLAAFQNCSGGFATNRASSSGTKADAHFYARTAPGCKEIRWKFLGFKFFIDTWQVILPAEFPC